jgi:hypothetical protein
MRRRQKTLEFTHTEVTVMNKQQTENEISRKEAEGQPKSSQLTDQQMDSVVGGTKNTSSVNLYQATSTGKHFKKATIDF